MMQRPVRLVSFVIGALAIASALALQSAAGVPRQGNSFRATFVESRALTTDRIADLGSYQFVNTGSGTVDGHGKAAVVLAMSQDRTVQPCGPGSWTNAGIRRIVLADGVLVLHETGEVCDTEIGPVARGTWTADGTSSTGVFAGASGNGRTAVYIPARLSTLTGSLRLGRGGASRP